MEGINLKMIIQYHIFANKKMFAVSYPLISKKCTGKALKLFNSQYRVPGFLTFDGAAE